MLREIQGGARLLVVHDFWVIDSIVYVIPTLRRISLELVTSGNHFTVVINLAGGIRCANAKLTRSFIEYLYSETSLDGENRVHNSRVSANRKAELKHLAPQIAKAVYSQISTSRSELMLPVAYRRRPAHWLSGRLWTFRCQQARSTSRLETR